MAFRNIALALTALAAPAMATHEVFAHVIVGNTSPYTYQDFYNDISSASAASIDGFALNIGADSYTTTSLNNYYQAAENFNKATGKTFSLFISFDYAVTSWDPANVVSTIKAHSSSSAQFKVNGKAMASTFLGTANEGDWDSIKSQANAYFVPDYSDRDPAQTSQYSSVDGLLSWDAWPDYTATTPTSDGAYKHALSAAGKSYMMPVSPWFYADCYGKDWIWNTDQLWPLRWQQVYATQPDYLELLTWNDYGESHYLGPQPAHTTSYPNGSQDYNTGMVHNAWLSDLPYYIQRYKNGGAEPAASAYTEHLTFWYRLNPKSACGDGGATCNSAQNGQTTHPAVDCAQDQVNFSVFTPDTATVTVTIGGGAPVVRTASQAGLFSGSVPFNGQTGAVRIKATMGGRTIQSIQGPDITATCAIGHVNWNAWVGGGVPS